MDVKSFAKSCIPPIALPLVRKLLNRSKYGFSGDYISWDDAMTQSIGYDAPTIVERVDSAMKKVMSGEAVYERDSVLFDTIQYSWPMLAGLLRVAGSHDGCLGIVDYGGALGTSYHQNKRFLSMVRRLRWCIVDQPSFITVGKERYQDDILVFYNDIHECIDREQINVVLLSGVLQYLQKPHELLQDILSLAVDSIIVDRTPFLVNAVRDRLTVQTVPPDIYPASYPHWFFERSGFLKHFSDHRYDIVAEFEGFDTANIRNSVYCGFIFDRSEQAHLPDIKKEI